MDKGQQAITADEMSDIYQSMQVPLANEVQIPSHITVHLGTPHSNARSVRVGFADYIKNVASSEIYPTWHESALYANIYCQISFALNRTFTRWYPSRGYSFDITNSTQFDQYFIEGRNIFQNISRIVDNIFNMFNRRPGRREPFISSYCNGTTSRCDGLSQWGSQELALRGFSPIAILRHYFPSDIQIVESTNFSSGAGVYPGVALREGSSGANVLLMQRYLNRISGNFWMQPIPNPTGQFNSRTRETTVEFQRIAKLLADGVIGKSTWYEITRYYVAVRQLAELTSEGQRIGIGNTPPTSVLRLNARGEDVVELQFILNYIASFFTDVPKVIENGVYREDTRRSVEAFQRQNGLTADGIVGPSTWRKLYDVYHAIRGSLPPGPPDGVPQPPIPPYPGVLLRNGSRGNDVRIMQTLLNEIGQVYTAIQPRLSVDGIFGPNTQRAVTAFQRQFGLTADGIIGPITWYRIVDVYNLLPSVSPPSSHPYPGTPLRVGSRGDNVSLMQGYLNTIAGRYTSIPRLTVDGIFGPATERSVMAFQREFGLTADGIIGDADIIRPTQKNGS